MTRGFIRTLTFTAIALLIAPVVYAQSQPGKRVPDQDLQLLRKDLRSQKKQLVAANIQLTDSEAQEFWPIYDKYAADSATIYDARYLLIKEYADNIQNLSDTQAGALAKRATENDGQMVQLRLKYLPTFEHAIGGKKTALFFQLERRIALMIDLQLASEIPLVQP